MSSAKIVPVLWFTAPQALHAANFYVNLFNTNPAAANSNNKTPVSSITSTTKYPNAQPAADNDTEDTCKPPDPGSILTVTFTLAGTSFTAMNGNKEGTEMPWKFNEAISFQVQCETQEEIDHFWDGITSAAGGGKESFCGWCKDRWGVSWQITPVQMRELMGDEGDGDGDRDPAARERVTKKMFTMKKLDLAALRDARDGVD